MFIANYHMLACCIGIAGLMHLSGYCTEPNRNKQTELTSSTGIEKQEVDPDAPYDFNAPTTTFELPKILNEISGIVFAGSNTLYCVQDENGSIYKYDLVKRAITADISFGEPGDYEDIAFGNEKMYVLRSDATLFILDQLSPENVMHESLAINCTDVEGLFYDQKQNVLYVACKNPAKDGDKSVRSVYQVPANKLDAPKEYLSIHQSAMEDKMSVKADGGKKSKSIFNPSAIAVHPQTSETFILSASGRYIAVYKETALQSVHPLDPEIYYQPEGIAFSPNGDLYVSSEGSKDGKRKAVIQFLKKR